MYFGCVRLLGVWIENPGTSERALHSSFVVLGIYKILDTVTNLTAVPRIARHWLKKSDASAAESDVPARKKINDWYLHHQPRIVPWFFISVPFLLAEPLLPGGFRLAVVAVYLAVEISVEARLFGPRLWMWKRDLHDGRR